MSKNVSFQLNNNNNIKSKNIDDNLNKNIGPYIIINKIKEGINSKIYLAKSKYTNDEVAIKAISKETLLNNLEDLILIYNHIQSLKILKHKNIITLYEIYESPKYFYLIFEYFPKKNLIEKIILKKRLNENESLVIFVQLLDALVYMHKMNIAHRNIRTEHILFDKNNRPKIIGFNYSTFYEKDKKLKGSFGSLCYACPEILNEEEYNPELADVWSLGVVLYVMICGYLPFSEENDEKNKNLILEGKVEYPKEISNKVKDLLKHMLEVDSKRRYNLQKITKHPWVKPMIDKKNIFIGGINVVETKYPVDEKILNIIGHYFKNFDKNEIRQNLLDNKYNEGTGLYKLLLSKIIEMKINSISDLFNNDFIEYMQNNDNNINENNNNLYKEYIDKLNKKINKLEKYIDDYKKREDDTAKYLLNIAHLKKSIKINNIKNSIIRKSKYNNELNYSNLSHASNKNDLRNDTNDYIIKNEDDLDIDLLQKFQEEQDKQKKDNKIENNNNQKLAQSLFFKKKVFNGKNSIFNRMASKNESNTSKSNDIYSQDLDQLKSITPDTQKFINHILVENENENKFNSSLFYSIRKKHTYNYRKSIGKGHIDRGSKLDDYLKKNHPENIRKTLLRYSLFSNISEEDVDDDKKNNEIKENDDIKDSNNDDEKKKKKFNELRFSLSFMDDGEGEEEESAFNESSYISRNDTRFISEIKDAIKELNDLKKKEKEKKEKEKEREKMNNGNNDVNQDIECPIKRQHNIKNKTNRDKEKNVRFKKFIDKNNDKDKDKNKFNTIINNNNCNYTKENVNNFIIKKDKNNEEKNNYIVFEGSDFSFHDEGGEPKEKKSLKYYSFKSKDTNICNYKNDKLKLSKLNYLFNIKEVISIMNIENKRRQKYDYSFYFDKHKIKKINVDNNIKNEKFIENYFKVRSDKKKILCNRSNHKKGESLEIFDIIENEQNSNNKNNIVKYQESILNRSNNLQSEQNINSSNNSYISNNIKNNSNSLYTNGNNQIFLYDHNNFIINNENNEEDDFLFKNNEKNKDALVEVVNSNKNSQNSSERKKYRGEKKYIDLMKRIEILNRITNQKENKKIVNYNENKKDINYASFTADRKNKNYNENHKMDKLFKSMSEKNRENKSFVYKKSRIRNKSMENKRKNYFYIHNQKISKNNINRQKDTISNSLKSERHNKNPARKKINNMNPSIKYNSYNNINLKDSNSSKLFSPLNDIKNITPIKLYKKKRCASTLNKDINLYVNHDLNSNKEANSSLIKTNSNDRTIRKTSNKIFKITNNKKRIISNKSNIKQNTNKDSNTKNNKFNGNLFNSNMSKSVCLINQARNEKNKAKQLINNKPKLKINRTAKKSDIKIIKNKEKKIDNKKKDEITFKDNNNYNVIHKKIAFNKTQNKNLENMILKRKEIVRRIRNFKKALNSLEVDKKYNTANLINELDIDKEGKNNNNNFNNSPTKHKKILSDLNIFDTLNDSIKNKQIYNEDKNKHKSCKNSPNIFINKGNNNDKIRHKKNNIYHNCIIKNTIYENNIKNYIYNANSINNISLNTSSFSQDNIEEKNNNNNKKKTIQNDTNNNLLFFSLNL